MSHELAATGKPEASALRRLRDVATRCPERLAIAGREATLSYRQLEMRVNQFANAVAGHGPAPVVVVGVEDRAELIAAMLGVFRGGGVFVPIDPSWPDARITGVLSRVSPALAVVDGPAFARLDALAPRLWSTTAVVTRDRATRAAGRAGGWAVIDPGELASDHAAVEAEPDALRYVYFTSGSTGQPKGIAGRLSALDHFVRWETREFRLPEGCRVSQLVTPTFDAFFRDTLVPLALGGVICLPPRRPAELAIADLLDWIDDARIQLIHCVPSLFTLLLEGHLTPDRFPALRHVLLSGEAIAPAIVRRWRQVFGDRIELVNLYGATETTMIRFFHRISAADLERGVIPVGVPIDDTGFLLLDDRGVPCAPGETGEVYVRTPHRSLGYYRDPAATGQVFVPNPLTGDPGDVVYRTGDLGRVSERGDLEFLGRRDRQVKINGIRVELDEVKNAILGHPGIRDCAVVMTTSGRGRGGLIAKDGGELDADAPAPRLVAYVVADDAALGAGLRAHLTARLPSYMIPARLVRLAALPLNSNGKLDIEALPPPERLRPEGEIPRVPPRSDMERRIATAWEEALGIEQVGVDDDFLDLGGESLVALRVANRLRVECGREVTARDLFECETVARLAERLSGRPVREAVAGPVPHATPVERDHPLSLAQQGLFYLWQADPANPYYTAHGVFVLRGPLEVAALEQAWAAVLARHEALRARFTVRDGRPVQEFDDVGAVRLPVTDLGAEGDALASVRQVAARWTAEPFDLERGPICRLRLFRRSEQEHLLLLAVHEIVHDLWSVTVLMQDLAEAYRRCVTEGSAALPRLPVPFRDWVRWEATHVTRPRLAPEEAFWRAELAGRLPVLDLPLDRPRPAAPSYRGGRTAVWLDAERSQRLHALSQAHRATLFVTLLSAFQVLLRRYSGQTDIIVGAPLANRQQAATERLVGFFLNMLPLRARFADEPTFAELLARNRRTVAAAIANATYPFLWMLEWADAPRDPRFTPVFQVMFNITLVQIVVESG